ncbi:nitronate monooxygenase [Pararhizobium sp. A13]|uniref:NAD(P)H-dependent flavin oxidoreductase n=1 Tax=Pararhizobium sp. A13 TaxID=3133975 RepID=UPI0032451A42
MNRNIESEFSRKLDLKHPLIVAPMAGGPSSVELVAETSIAGALGSIGAAYSQPAAIEEFAAKVRQRTDCPFAVNLFVPHPTPRVTARQIEHAIAQTAPYRSELGLPTPEFTEPYEGDFDAQFDAVLRIRPAAFSFVFGLLPPDYVRAARKEKIVLIGTATTPEEAAALEDSGADAVVLQGIEAGGHRGIFDAGGVDEEINAFDLLKASRVKVRIPLIAAGGIMTSSDVRRALQAGAQAVQMGTAFLVCEEAGTSAPYKQKLLDAAGRTTKTTRVFSGRLARGIENRFMHEMETRASAILPFPAQNKFTRDMRGASAAKGSADFLSLWSGTGQGDLWRGPARELIARLC